MDPNTLYLYLAVIFGFLMAWGIGANDVSNAMGASVGSKAISIRQAILIAAIFEFLGAFLAGGEVTQTIQKNIIDTTLLADTPYFLILGMLASLLSAGSWLMLASTFGWPVSTTHTIVGAIIGFGILHSGMDAVQWDTVWYIVLGWIMSPILGAVISYILFYTAQQLIFNKPSPLQAAKNVVPFYILLAGWIVGMITTSKLDHFGITLTQLERVLYAFGFASTIAILGKLWIGTLNLDPAADRNFHYTNVEKIFTVLMIFTACAMAFAHGSNDVANAIGPVSAVVNIVQNGGNVGRASPVPIWVLLLGASGIVLGLVMYGHKVIATVGNNITQLTPSRGFSATLAAAATVVMASSTGLPISTTHTLVGGILGIGLARGIHALNMSVIKTIFMSWVITLPAGTLLCIIYFRLLNFIFTMAAFPTIALAAQGG